MYINAQSGHFQANAMITLGARGDSYYEYLLKQWLVTGKRDTHFLHQYLDVRAQGWGGVFGRCCGPHTCVRPGVPK
jgi:hypothetical protein